MEPTELIKERVSIVDLVGESVPLKKVGRNFKGLCPFHTERTPSFIVSPERQIWHCFGCQKGGDIFTFLMELDRLEFTEALRILAVRAGVKLETRPQTTKTQQLREQLLAIHHLAQEYFHYLLTKHPVAARARSYLKERGVSEAIVKTFSLGYAPQAWDNVYTFLRKRGYSPELIEQSGLTIKGNRGWYDRFRGRIMFPIKNYRGETIAFSGRVLDPQAKGAKYINSPETPIYTKGETLYGLEVTREAIRKEGVALIVEGEFDVLSSFQAGISNIVAIKGSALAEAQVRLMKRFTERIILALDVDSAGDAAARRGFEIADRAGMDIRVVEIEGSKDPDEVARADPGLWKKVISQAIPVYDFLINSALKRYNSAEAFGKRKVSEEILPVIANIENTIVQAHYIKTLAQKLSLPEEKITEALRKQTRTSPTIRQKEIPQAASSRLERIEEHLLALVLQSELVKQALAAVGDAIDPSDLTQPVIRKLFIALFDYTVEQATLDMAEFTKSLPKELTPAFDHAFLEDLTAFASAELYEKELMKTLTLIQKEFLRRKITELSTNITQAEKNSDSTRLETLHKELSLASQELKRLNT